MSPSLDAPIFLIGYRATGKTTVSRWLARRLGYDSVDADDEIERHAGNSIARIFADEGEAAFRDLESRVIADLCQRQRIVASLGGGGVLREANRAAIRAAGPVIWLTASIDTIVRRLAHDPATSSRRPNLTKTGGRAEIEALLRERIPIYRGCATFEVDTEGKATEAIVEEIVLQLATE